MVLSIKWATTSEEALLTIPIYTTVGLGTAILLTDGKKEGDEAFTNVPSNTLLSDYNRDSFYRGSSVLVEKADHIRLQYINFNYRFDQSTWKSKVFENLNLFINLSNLGILWKANKSGIDPDFNYETTGLKPPAVYTIGLRANF